MSAFKLSPSALNDVVSGQLRIVELAGKATRKGVSARLNFTRAKVECSTTEDGKLSGVVVTLFHKKKEVATFATPKVDGSSVTIDMEMAGHIPVRIT